MRLRTIQLAFPWVVAAGVAGVAAATTFHCDPVRGAAGNPGTSAEPWGALEEVIARGMIELRDAGGKVAKPGAPVKGGDTILLHGGWHGKIHLRAGYNDEFITIAAAPGQLAEVSQVVIDGGRRWRVRGLRVSPSLAPRPPREPVRHLVQLGEHGGDDSTGLVVEDCFVFSVADASGWSAADWMTAAASGIWLGRHGRGHVARNNYVRNTRMGIDLCAPAALCEGNVVDGFSADGIRVTRDAIVVRHNVIKNNHVGEAAGDANHDDGIQCFLFNRGRGLVRDVVIEGNIIIERERPGLPLGNPLQGIGFFDGPLVHFTVRDNVVRVDHWHGVSLFDAQGCRVAGNACWNPDPDSQRKPWVMLGGKQGLARGNRVEDNLAHSFNLAADPGVSASGNRTVDAGQFEAAWKRARDRIERAFGAEHPLARLPRVAGASP